MSPTFSKDGQYICVMCGKKSNDPNNLCFPVENKASK